MVKATVVSSFSPKGHPLTDACNLLDPALWDIRQWASPRVRNVILQTNFVEDGIDLVVVHRLFDSHELADGSFRQSFRSRVREALLADKMPDGRALVVERRSFLARAARLRKVKPRKTDV